MTIRPASDSDRDAIWEIFQEVIAAGETYPIESNIPREDALRYWFKHNAHVCVAEADSQIIGSYTLHQNQAAGGSHVANAAFVVDKNARGLSRDSIQLRRFKQRRRGETLARPWNEDRRHTAGRVQASDARVRRCLRDVSRIHLSFRSLVRFA
jgi:hypothetical protein